MFRCSRAVFASSFRFRRSRFAASPDTQPSSRPPSRIRPRRPAALAALVSGAALWACADSVWEPPGAPPSNGDRVMAAVVTETEGFLADAPALRGWESVARGIGSPGCVFHFRRVTGAFASKEYRFEYSRRAMKGPKGWRPLVYNVPVVVTRPTADGGTETLPERLAIRAVCLMPRTDRGTVEAIGSVEAILKAMGILSAKKGMADAGHAVPKGEGPSAVLAALGWVRERLSVRPLSAAQEGCSASTGAETGECAIETDDIVVTGTPSPIPISCPAGFDYEGTTNSCRISVNLGGGGANPGDTNTGGSGGGNGDGGDGEEGGPRTVDFTLTCSDSVPRGSGGSCGVSAPDSAGVSMGALDIAWSSTTGATDSGLGLSAWSGTATETVTVTVAITDPAGAIAGFSDDETVTVTSRGWTWGDSVVNANFTFSSLDSCFPAGALAATIPANCAADWVQSSYTPGPATVPGRAWTTWPTPAPQSTWSGPTTASSARMDLTTR